MRARRFTADGMTAFGQYVQQARELSKLGAPVPPVPPEWLIEAQYAEPVAYELPASPPEFKTKLDIGVFISGVFPDSDHEVVRTDEALWTWLAAKYFDHITATRTKIKEPRAYVAGITFQEFYRHLILGPYYVY